MTTMVAPMAETLHWSVGHEFGHQVMVLFLQSPIKVNIEIKTWV